ncbi:tripartite tricarboxylate transporter substrate binding protein [Bordetella pseudohinzii]|uniref:Argininosuccinate lyase n=1 Tax=Bordetella pseudohinzii TaxID=1331258 RepID=A0A0J6C0B6_9BORD|nr:tripartite tricarboxylate transporter substrate binding protein [Bordetella pseudohinzii]ANY16107.1 MFS transporter [Bordetella pseudohinzii]KMM24493.1 MFS transporter [Bordetella pseudohinzii]KXA78516.1 MFS transporter [Bordetella pseudohinzii]KXA78584.1 MFS transporter [Bordetella pseudohinzii]CUJ10455.1 Argininosuccinate lyase [Bordetella pseudohinzii]
MQCNWLRALACAAMLFAATAHADTYPSKPVTMVVPYPAGGATDVVARAVAERLTQSWGQSVIVENRAGAGTTIGASSVARARGDGYTLFMTTSAHTISGHLYSKLNYDPVKDFAPITLVTKVPLVLVINPAIPAKTLPEFLAYLKQNGASVNFASPGNGTAQHLSGELFKIATQSNITHVPYRGDAPAFTDLAGGQVQMMLATITSALPLIESGKLRALAVANGKRVQALRDVPTFAEAGMPGFEAATWFGILAPAALPQAQAQRIYEDVSKIVATPEMQARIEGLGGEVVNSTPKAFAAFMKEEEEKWGQAVKASGAVAAQ